VSETLFGIDSVGTYFVSPEIIQILVALTAPQPKEKVLNIHLNPEVLIPCTKSIVEQSMNDTDVKYLHSRATPEEVAQAEGSIINCVYKRSLVS